MKIRAVFVTAFMFATMLSPLRAYASVTEICKPEDGTVYKAGDIVEIEAAARYKVPEGTDYFAGKKDYLYFRISKDGQTLLYDSCSYASDLGVFSYARESFTPAEEGEYLIEICRDDTYEEGRHVDLKEEDFQADDYARITVTDKADDVKETDTRFHGIPLAGTLQRLLFRFFK